MAIQLAILRITYDSAGVASIPVTPKMDISNAVWRFLDDKGVRDAVDHVIPLPAGQADIALCPDKINDVKAVCETMDIEDEFSGRDIITRIWHEFGDTSEETAISDKRQRLSCYEIIARNIETPDGKALYNKRIKSLRGWLEYHVQRKKADQRLEEDIELAKACCRTLS